MEAHVLKLNKWLPLLEKMGTHDLKLNNGLLLSKKNGEYQNFKDGCRETSSYYTKPL